MGVVEEFFGTLQRYNEAVLPMLVVTYVLARAGDLLKSQY
jgi:hypothetical protein